VGIFAERFARGVPQASRHPEVDQENATGFESDNQILAAALQRSDPLALELRGDRERLERPDEPRVVDLDALERAADDVRLECETDRLDLGELGHQPIVSRTIGVACGASSPNVYAASTSSAARAAAFSSCA